MNKLSIIKTGGSIVDNRLAKSAIQSSKCIADFLFAKQNKNPTFAKQISKK